MSSSIKFLTLFSLTTIAYAANVDLTFFKRGNTGCETDDQPYGSCTFVDSGECCRNAAGEGPDFCGHMGVTPFTDQPSTAQTSFHKEENCLSLLDQATDLTESGVMSCTLPWEEFPELGGQGIRGCSSMLQLAMDNGPGVPVAAGSSRHWQDEETVDESWMMPPPADPAEDEISQGGPVRPPPRQGPLGQGINGPSTNGASMNGASANGGAMNEGAMNGAPANGGTMNGGATSRGATNGGLTNGRPANRRVIKARGPKPDEAKCREPDVAGYKDENGKMREITVPNGQWGAVAKAINKNDWKALKEYKDSGRKLPKRKGMKRTNGGVKQRKSKDGVTKVVAKL